MSELQKSERKDLKSLMNSEDTMNRLKEILGKNAATFATSVVQIASQNSMLANAEPRSVLGAAMTAATLNLPLNNALGLAYILPFNEKQKDGSKVIKAQFIVGWKGFVRLAQRSGQFLRINSGVVKEGEILSKDRLTGDIEFEWIQDEKERELKKPVGYFAYFRLVNGYEHTLFMTMEELHKHAKKYSQTFKGGYGLWSTDFDSMAQKTVLKLLISKYAPLSISMETAVKTDQAVVNEIGETEDISYVDNDEPEHDPNLERQRLLIDEAKTLEDIEFAEEHVTDPILIAQLDLKKVQIKKESKTDKK